MTYPPGPDHVHARGQTSRPPDIDTTGIPSDANGNEAFVLLMGVGLALLALLFTLGWVVFHHLQAL